MKDFKGGKFAGNRDRGGVRSGGSFGAQSGRSFGSNHPRFGGRSSFGGGRGTSQGGFGARSASGSAQLHQAVCDGCGNGCEVPFRPTGEKPIYCQSCFKGSSFDQSKNYARTGERTEPREPRTVAIRSEVVKHDSRVDELLKSVTTMQTKLDRILFALEKSDRKERVEKQVPTDTVAELVAETSGKVKKSLKKALANIGDSIADMGGQKKKPTKKSK